MVHIGTSRFRIPLRLLGAVAAAAVFLFGGNAAAVVSASPAIAPISHAQNLEISTESDADRAATVTVRNAWPDAPELVYALVPREAADGQEKPPPPDLPSGGTAIEAPVKRIVSLATPNIPFLRDLGALDALVAVDTADYVYDRRVLQRYEDGLVHAVGTGSALDVERVVELRPEVVLVSALGPDDATIKRLEGAGIPVIVVADWREHTPLGRAEWIRLFGALFDRNETATELFREREQRYNYIRRVISEEVDPAEKPTVMTNGPWQGQWPVPGGDSYMARLLADAGADYLWSETTGTGSVFLDLEAVLARALDADYWINLNFDWTGREDVRNADPRLTAFRAYRENTMYHHIRRVRASGANDFWETGVGRPDIVLADLVSILHPDLHAKYLPEHDPVYYRRIDP